MTLIIKKPTGAKLVMRKQSSTWAEGGDLVYTIVVDGTTYRVHTFTTVGTSTLTVLNGGEFEYLIVGGGGSGGSGSSTGAAGGGGGGGLLKFVQGEAGNTGSTPLSLPPGLHNVAVGNGGSAFTSSAVTAGNDGFPSSLLTLSASGGGGGGAGPTIPGASGGSGGGGGASASAVSVGGSAVPTGQGFGGGSGGADATSPGGGGGGGAGQAGFTFQAGLQRGNGGDGLQTSITGIPVFYAGGGGGHILFGSPGLGGNGGGGNGAQATNIAQSGENGTGGGGGGGRSSSATVRNGSGGSGIVIVRYAI